MALSRSMKSLMMAQTNRAREQARSRPPPRAAGGAFGRSSNQSVDSKPRPAQTASSQPRQGLAGRFGAILDKKQQGGGVISGMRDRIAEKQQGGGGLGGMMRRLMEQARAKQSGSSFDGGAKPRPAFQRPAAGANYGARYAKAKSEASRGKPTPNVSGRQAAGVQGPTRPRGAQRAFGGSRRFLR